MALTMVRNCGTAAMNPTGRLVVLLSLTKSRLPTFRTFPSLVAAVPNQRRQSLEFGVGDMVLEVNGRNAQEFDNEASMNSLLMSWSDFGMVVAPQDESKSPFSSPKTPSGKKKALKKKAPHGSATELWSSRSSIYSPTDDGWSKVISPKDRLNSSRASLNSSRASLVASVMPANLDDDEDPIEKIRRLNKERAENMARRKSEREEVAQRRQSDRVVRRRSIELVEEKEAMEEAERLKAEEAARVKAKLEARGNAMREKVRLHWSMRGIESVLQFLLHFC
jgi:hypothetical protein